MRQQRLRGLSARCAFLRVVRANGRYLERAAQNAWLSPLREGTMNIQPGEPVARDGDLLISWRSVRNDAYMGRLVRSRPANYGLFR